MSRLTSAGHRGPALDRGQAKEREGEKQPAVLPSSVQGGKTDVSWKPGPAFYQLCHSDSVT